jgi:flagellar protein FliJ
VKAYRFRLESVLRVRQLQERATAQRLALSMRAVHSAQDEYAGARRALEAQTPPSGRVTTGAAQWSHAQSERMAETAGQKAQGVREAREGADQARDDWGGASRRTATLERLNERHQELWRAELHRSDAAVLDDLAGTRMISGTGAP